MSMMKMKLFKQTGAYHTKTNACCQDSAAFVSIGEDTAVAAVSDGCSNSLLGHIGSAVSVRVFTELFSAIPEEKLKKFCISGRYDDELKKMVIEAIQKAIAENRAEHQLFSATLVGCICHKKRAVFIHVGDGFAARLKYRHISVVSKPENRERTNQTYFVTEPCAKQHIRITRIKSYDKLLLSTDGLSKAKLNRELFEFEGIEKFLISNRENLFDDCSAVVIQSIQK